MALGTAMQKIETAIIAVVLGIAFPFIVTYLVSGGATSSFLIPCTNSGSGVCQVGTISGNVITLPEILVSTANLVKFMRACDDIDVRSLLPAVRVPTIVFRSPEGRPKGLGALVHAAQNHGGPAGYVCSGPQ